MEKTRASFTLRLAGSLVALVALSACDTGGNFPGPHPNPVPQAMVNGRIALIGCQRDPLPQVRTPGTGGYGSGAHPLLTPQNLGGIGPASIKVVSINPSGAFNGFYNRNSYGPQVFNAGLSAIVTSQSITIGSDVEDIVFTPKGDMALVAMRGSSQVMALAVDPIGNLRIYGVFNIDEPLSIATDDRTAFVVSGKQNRLYMLDLTRVDYVGTPVPYLLGGPLTLDYRATNNGSMKLKKVIVGQDVRTGEAGMVYVAAEGPNGGIYKIDPQVARGEEPVNYGEVSILVDRLSAYNGVEEKMIHLGMVNTMAISPSGLLVVNDLNRGPRPMGYVHAGDSGEIYELSNQSFEFAHNMAAVYSQSLRGVAVKDVGFAANGSTFYALSDTAVHSYVTESISDLGFQRQPIRVGRGNARMAIDHAQGEFMMVMSPNDNSFSVLRMTSNGILSYNGAADTIRTDSLCVGPSVAAIQPRQVIVVPPTPTATPTATPKP